MSRTSVLIPIRSLSGGKSRLGELFDAESRQKLVVRMAEHVIQQVTVSGIADQITVVTGDPTLEQALTADGVRFLLQPDTIQGLNPAISFGREAALADGADRLLVLFADLPEISAADLIAIDQNTAPVTIIPDQQLQGTNALLLQGRAVLQRFNFHYGIGSHPAHLQEASSLDFPSVSFPITGLAVDLDTPADWIALSSTTQSRLLADERPMFTSQTAAAVLMEHA